MLQKRGKGGEATPHNNGNRKVSPCKRKCVKPLHSHFVTTGALRLRSHTHNVRGRLAGVRASETGYSFCPAWLEADMASSTLHMAENSCVVCASQQGALRAGSGVWSLGQRTDEPQ